MRAEVERLWHAADQLWKDTRDLLARAGTPVSCKGKGCNGCCRGEVVVDKDEARVIARALSRRQRATVLSTPDPPDPTTAVCIFLGAGGGCSIYPFRPAVCRTYAVITPADYCYPERSPGALVGRCFSQAHAALHASAIESGGPLVPMLRAAILALPRRAR